MYTIMKRVCVSQVVTYYFCERCSMKDICDDCLHDICDGVFGEYLELLLKM